MGKRRYGLFIILLGIVLLIVGFVFEGVLAGIPYQDPTPELLQKYMHYVNVGHIFYKIGLIVGLVGVLTMVLQKVYKSCFKQKNIT